MITHVEHLACDYPGCKSQTIVSEIETKRPWTKLKVAAEVLDGSGKVGTVGFEGEYCYWHLYQQLHDFYQRVEGVMETNAATRTQREEAQNDDD